MIEWFHSTIDSGRLPLFLMMVAFVLTFAFIRLSTRMIRAQVSWWPGNVTPGGLHIHHVMFGLVMMLIAGFALIALANYHTPVLNCVLAALFGVGGALVLDEFAMVLHLRDVYWAEEGRTSIDAIFVAFAITILFVLGIHPVGLSGDFDTYENDRQITELTTTIVVLGAQYALAAITLFKGKIWTGLIGLFFPILLIVGAVRLARPESPWARRRYGRRPRKGARSRRREKKLRYPMMRAKVRVQEAIAGRFDSPEDTTS